MKPERWKQIERLYHAALGRESGAREAFLAQACAGDEELRREVEELLRYDGAAGSFIEGNALAFEARRLDPEELSQTRPHLLPGQGVGAYKILALLGRGGMGVVYRARDERLRRDVAVKVLPASFANDADRLRRFEQEAHATSALNHPNIITIYEIGQVEGVHFIATEFIDGQTLRQRMAGARLKLRDAIEVATQIASALAAAHEAGITHRDTKPENVMVRPDGLVKVLDFGLAKLTQEPELDKEAATLVKVDTDPGIVIGTITYMSPEQARGLEVDGRSDIFSLGVTLYEMLTGKTPFEGATTADVIAAILDREPPPLSRYSPEVPAELQRIVTKALCKALDKRYQSIKDLLVDLRNLKQELEFESKIAKAEQPITSRKGRDTAPATEYFISEIKRHKWGAMLVVVAVAAIAFSLSGLIGSNKPKHETPLLAMKIKRLTSTGKATRAAISPDGKYVVHVLSDAGKQILLVQQVTESNPIEIVPPAEVTYFELTFSRDGVHVFYVAQEQNSPILSLYQVPALGGVSRRILKDIYSPVTISPDNKQLAFIRRSRGQNEDAVIIADINGANERKLASRRGADFFGTSGPAWSPDGKLIATAAGSKTGRRYTYIAEINVADGKEKPVSEQRWTSIGRVSWARDDSSAGRGLIFSAQEQGAAMAQVWYLPYPKGNPQRITNDLNDYRDVSLTDDSTALVTIQAETHVNVWLITNRSASRAKQITDEAGQNNGVGGVTWMPDGRIVYVSRATGSQDIWLMDQDGKNRRQLTTPETRIDRFPAVTPDGRYIVFVSTRTGNSNIYRYDLSTGEQKQLTNGVSEEFPAVSADGKWVIYTATGTSKPTLWKVSIDGGDAVQLTDKLSIWPDVSPDGQKIACWYRAEPGANWQIAVIPITGGSPEKVIEVPPNAEPGIPIRWTPDGRGISYVDTRNGVSNIWNQPMSGGAPTQLTHFASDVIFWFDWSRDGGQLAVSRGKVISDVVHISGINE